jgi:hypothetical protein
MDWTLIMHHFYTDEKCNIPFSYGQVVYYAHPKKWWKENSKWILTRTNIIGLWATNTYGVTLGNNEQIHYSNFDKLFTNREAAIEYCIKKNTHAKVKIYGE